MKKIIMTVALAALMVSCGGGATNDYAKAFVAACEESIEAVEAADNEEEFKKAKDLYWKAVTKAKKDNLEAKKMLDIAEKIGDEAALADFVAIQEAQTKYVFAKNRKKNELKKK